jgi:vacuolar protein sorting-associated protein 11
LHEHHKATADHTTLLLNCYAKLKDIEKLERFIKSPGDLKFDLDTAISMCRQGGYYEQAAYLATKHGEHELVVDILIEDSKKYAEALQYIWHLEPEAVSKQVRELELETELGLGVSELDEICESSFGELSK